MKPILLVRNDENETFGVAPAALFRAGCDILTANMTDPNTSLPPLDAVSGVIAFGGTVNVDETDRFPYLALVREYTREAVERSIPFLGICLGSQLLARALGGEVFGSPVKESGFEPLHPTAEAKHDPLLALYTDGDMVFQWHEDTYELPEHATLLAAGDRVPVQAYRAGERAWGVQFHQEVDSVELAWWIGIAESETDLKRRWGKSADEMRVESARYIAEHEERGRELFRRFAREVKRLTW